MSRNPYRWPSLFPKGGHTMTTDQWVEAVAPLFLKVSMRERRKRIVPRLSVLDRRTSSRSEAQQALGRTSIGL